MTELKIELDNNMLMCFALIFNFLFIMLMTLSMISCSNNSDKFKDGYDSEYRVRDRGKLNAAMTGKGCSINSDRALHSAKKAAEFNLRSLVGNESYRTKFTVIKNFKENGKICYEIQAQSS